MLRRMFMFATMIAVALVSVSPIFDSVIVEQGYDFNRHQLGLPLPIIEQHTSLTPEDNDFPLEVGLLDPRENPTDLLLGNYILSVAVTAGIVYLLLYVLRFIIISMRKV